MFRRFSVNFAVLSMGVDGVCVLLGLWLAMLLRPTLSALKFIGSVVDREAVPWFFFIGFGVVWVSIFILFSLYDGRRYIRIADEISALLLASFLASITIAGILYVTYRDLSRALFLSFILITFLLVLLWRLIARKVFQRLNGAAAARRNLLIVGAGVLGREIQGLLQENHFYGLNLVGFLDDDLKKTEQYPEVLGTPEQLIQIVSQYAVEDVILALPNRAFRKIEQLIAELHTLPVKVWVVPDYFHLALHKAVFSDFAGIPMLDLRAPALNDYQRAVKRMYDLTISVMLLPLILPVMGILALLIWLDDRGPVFFKQVRVGENRELFEMWKFRSMVVNAEKMNHLVERTDEEGNLIHKTPDDPRVTRIGKFLRSTSLDEIPQIFNVLKGEMSLVGPRPEMPDMVEKYEPWQATRFAVPQGMTGWWQVNGRSDKPMHLNTKDDIYYVQHYSIWLDIQIMLKTILVVINRKGAF
jgi:exopolysaccharide biosynthesis polyprenyl glycosylphosphotransferase